jgi:RHS repeat-associated protein
VQQIITVPTVGSYSGFTATQKYYYDSLNRIDDATETISAQTWRQDFSYDRYGNRNFVETNTTTLPKNCGTSPNFTVCVPDRKIYNPSINTTNNRLNTTDNYAFDNSGNTKGDAQGRTFIYDGENKQVEVKNSSNVTIGQYVYDGDGKRVKKYVPSTGETTIFVYDSSGRSIAEYSTVVEPAATAKVAYLTNDHLGSPRINTDANGAVISRHDYHPFGEEVFTTQRTTALGYAADTVRKQFTGYERDKETDLDFAQARYYAKQLGRFMSADEPFADQSENNPQSWSLYAYVRNNPLNLIDPIGLAAECPPGYEGCYFRDGTWYTQDENGNEVSFDPVVIVIATWEKKSFWGKAWHVVKGVANALFYAGNPGYDDDFAEQIQSYPPVMAIGMIIAPEAKVLESLSLAKNSVYIARAGEKVIYAGITNKFARRAIEQLARRGINIEKLMEGLSRADARNVEEALIAIEKLEKNGGSLINKIHSISPKNPDYAARLQKGLELLETVGYK